MTLRGLNGPLTTAQLCFSSLFPQNLSLHHHPNLPPVSGSLSFCLPRPPSIQMPQTSAEASPPPPVCMGSEFWWAIITSVSTQNAALCPQASQRAAHSFLSLPTPQQGWEIHQLERHPHNTGLFARPSKPRHSADSDKSGATRQSLKCSILFVFPREKSQHQGWCPAAATRAPGLGTVGR